MGNRPPLNAQRDANEPIIFEALRSHGVHVHPLDVPLDALAWFGGVTYLVEVKNGPKAPFTKPQIKFLKDWPGEPVILRSVDDAIAWAKSLRRAANLTKTSGVSQ